MKKIAICIPTYKRPRMLSHLLDRLSNCVLDPDTISEVVIIVVDNDHEGTAEAVCGEFSKIAVVPFLFEYFMYAKKGLSSVRNELLRLAKQHNPDYTVFIDDDEFPSENWLIGLLNAITTTKADMALGPVRSVFESSVPAYLSCWFRPHQYQDHELIDFLETNNLMMSNKFIERTNLGFDERFNTTGGEDTYFGIEALKLGAKIAWAESAVVFETIPEQRATLNWLLRRSYRGAITYTYILKIESNNIQLIKKIIFIPIHFLLGLCGLIVAPFRLKWRYWGMIKMAEGLGAVAGLANVMYHEYS